MRPASSTSTSGVVRDPILMGGEPVPQRANPIASREVSLPKDGIRFESDTNFRSDETDARFEATAYRAYCHRRRHWRGLVFRFLGGLVIFFIMRALGELLLYRPVAGSFVTYADEFVGPFAGFVTGWSYWFTWVVTGMAELTAIGVYVSYWFPAFPQWITVFAALVVLFGANMLAVRVFGEMEFWFALIKVTMIIMLIVGGLVVILFGVGNLGATAGFSNLFSHGGFLPFGILGVLLTFQMVCSGFREWS
jgi:Amino acid permease